jgi:hypothetical protein
VNDARVVVERERHAVANDLPVHCVGDFLRLTRSLVYGWQFQFLVIDAPAPQLRQDVMTAIEQVLRSAQLTSLQFPLNDQVEDVCELEQCLVAQAQVYDVVHVLVSQKWFTRTRWDAFNVRRERIASNARSRILFWLDAAAIVELSHLAPDLWSWRSGVYAFVPNDGLQPAVQ